MQRRLAIIGGGAAGSALLAHLLRDASSDRSPALALDWITGTRAPGRGIAYDTADPQHLLNVRAANMSLFADVPADFLDYAQARGVAASDGQFLPRSLYGDYLDATLASLLATSGERTRLSLHATEAIALQRQEQQFLVRTRDGAERVVDEVVLALGALPTTALPCVSDSALASGAYASDPWCRPVPLRAPAHVLVIGTGLSAVDALLSAAARWPRARLTAVSRRGRLPALHAEHPLTPYADQADLLQRLHEHPDPAHWLRCFRAAARTADDWRAVLDAVRTHTPRLWQSLDANRRARFLRHLRPLWEVVRHRVPPQTAAKIQALRDSGRLRVIAARVRTVDGGDAGPLRVRLQQRDERRPVVLVADFVIQATGLESTVQTTSHPLVRQLVDARIAQPDALGLGLAALPDGRLLRPDGTPWSNLRALGILLRGTLWECSAMPEIRSLARDMARDHAQRAADGHSVGDVARV